MQYLVRILLEFPPRSYSSNGLTSRLEDRSFSSRYSVERATLPVLGSMSQKHDACSRIDWLHSSFCEIRHSRGFPCASFDLDYCPKGMDFLAPAGFACLGCTVRLIDRAQKDNPTPATNAQALCPVHHAGGAQWGSPAGSAVLELGGRFTRHLPKKLYQPDGLHRIRIRRERKPSCL